MWPFEPEGVILVRSQDTTVFYPLFQSSYSNFNNDKYNGASNTLIWLQLCYALFVIQIEVACFQHISWNIQIFAPVLHPSAAAQTPAEHRLPPSLCHIWDSLCPSPLPLWSIRYITALARVHHVTNSGIHVPRCSQWVQWRSFSTHVSSECLTVYACSNYKNSLR